MTLVLSHTSALEFYRHAPRPTAQAPAPSAGHHRSSDDVMLALQRNGCGYLPLPIHLLAPGAAARSRYAHTVSHLCSADVPTGSFLRISSEVAVASPELCFVFIAPSLSLAQLIKLGYELCGSYALRPDQQEGFVRRAPVTSKRALSAYLTACKKLNGREKAQSALKYIQEDSASPMETLSSMLAFLPCRLGGQGLPPGSLNGIVPANEFTRTLTGKSHLRGDILWREAKLCVEYDSDQHHTGARRIAEDASRRTALANAGFEVITLTRRHVLDIFQFNAVCDLLAKRLGKRRRGCATWMDRQRALRAEIVEFSSSRACTVPTVDERCRSIVQRSGKSTGFWQA